MMTCGRKLVTMAWTSSSHVRSMSVVATASSATFGGALRTSSRPSWPVAPVRRTRVFMGGLRWLYLWALGSPAGPARTVGTPVALFVGPWVTGSVGSYRVVGNLGLCRSLLAGDQSDHRAPLSRLQAGSYGVIP